MRKAVKAILKRMGIDTQQVSYRARLSGHGPRVLAEVHEYPAEVIELQLACAVRDPLGRAYNRTQHL